MISIKLDKFFNEIYSYFLPNVYAKRGFNFTEEDLQKSFWIVMYENLLYELYRKMNLIKDQTFVDFLKMSLYPNFEDYINFRKNNNIVNLHMRKLF